MKIFSLIKLALVGMIALLTAGCPATTKTYYLPMSGANTNMPVAQAEAICRNERSQHASAVADNQEAKRLEDLKGKNVSLAAQRMERASAQQARSMINLFSQFQSIDECMARHGFAKHKMSNY